MGGGVYPQKIRGYLRTSRREIDYSVCKLFSEAEDTMRAIRDFRPQQLYGVTQRGNRGHWVYRDTEDFLKALSLVDRAARTGKGTGKCLGELERNWKGELESAWHPGSLLEGEQNGTNRFHFETGFPH